MVEIQLKILYIVDHAEPRGDTPTFGHKNLIFLPSPRNELHLQHVHQPPSHWRACAGASAACHAYLLPPWAQCCDIQPPSLEACSLLSCGGACAADEFCRMLGASILDGH